MFHGAALLLPWHSLTAQNKPQDLQWAQPSFFQQGSNLPQTIPIKIPAAFSVEIGKPILKFIWNFKGLKIAKTVFKKMNEVGELSFLNFETYYKAKVIKTG